MGVIEPPAQGGNRRRDGFAVAPELLRGRTVAHRAGIRALEPLLLEQDGVVTALAVVMRLNKEVRGPRFNVRLSDLMPGWAGELPAPKHPDRIFIIDLEATGTLN
jgi:hypothetical protein